MANPSSLAIPAAKSPENFIASLMGSFSAVPPAAVPAVIDCVLASSSLFPSLLFSSILRSFPDPKEASQKNHILSYATALCHLVKSTDDPMDALRDFVWKVFVPVMKAIDPNDYELLNQIEETLFDVVSMMRAWELMSETLVPYCLRSVGLSMGMVQNDDLAIYQWSTEDSLERHGTLFLPIACRILTSILQCVLTSAVGVPNVRQNLEGFAANLLWDLSILAVGMLERPMEDRSFSIRLLLPSLFKWLNLFCSVEVLLRGSPYRLSRLSFAKDIWECCISLFSFGDIERRDAFNILSLYFSSFYNQQLYKNVERDNISIDFDITTEKKFWEEIRRGMVDGDPTLRKQALYILKLALNNHSSYSSRSDGLSTASAKTDQTISCNGTSEHSNMTKKGKWAEKEAKSLGVGEVCYSGEHCLSSQDRWKVFVLLYEMLEEYGTHLVEAAWTHQIFLLVQSIPPTNSDLHVTCGAGQIQMETTEGIFSWLAVLWERGFFHDNPQVRCLIMESFLCIDWEKDGNCATKVPRSFVLGPLLLGLNDAVHHKDFGVNGIYTSRTIQGATKYLFNLSCQMSSSERVDFIWSLASLTRQESFGRAGLMALAFCIASAACHTDSHNMLVGYNIGKSPENQQIESAQDFSLPSRGADLLDVLGFVIESSKQHFNPNYRLQVCEQVIKAASSVINISSMPLGLLLHFLSTVPREFTDREGTLRMLVQQWLTQSNNVDKGFGSFATETCVLNGLVSFPMSFIRKKNSLDCSFAYDDEDVEAWILEAQRWARVLFLVVREAQHLDPIFMFFQKYCSSLCNLDGIMEWVPIKLLILILSLVEELQLEWTKCEIYNEAKVGREHNSTGKLRCSSFLLTSTDCVTIHGKFASLMIELVAFSKLVSPIFWSFTATMDTQLPQSLRGKLGGPSQRRLASSTTSSVLQAILSLRTVACVSSLCTRLRRNDHLDYSFTFLWDFCWKTIESRGHNSETAAELRLAAYEALTSVFKEWSLSFTPSVYDFIMACNKSLFGAGEDKLLLDLLVNSFIHNVNDLLSKGVLTRSRRAVLMNWKWLCLDSLLSVPFNTVKNGIHIRNTHSFFSQLTLRSIFADIVESLENAGESSALYMLRSVRLLLGLLCSATISPKISSDPEVTCEMIEQLAHSSWFLHISCNKRRVAPIAALLSAVLHQSVFGDLRLHEANGSQLGPLKWFIGNLLDEGVKSPRTIRLAALHLTGLWLLHPKTVKYYIKELKLLSLYGSVAFDEDFEAELSENHEAKTEVSQLAQSQDSELTEVFINTELYARVSVAVLFFKLANLASDRGHNNEDSLAALDCGKMLLLELLDFAVNDKDLAKELYKKYSAVHRRKVRAWQMICILFHFVEKDIVEEVTSNLHICLYRNNLPAVRQYLEMFTIQVYLRFPMLAKEQLIPIFHDQNMRPQALSSYVFIAANIIVHASEPQIQRKHLNDLLPPIIPFLTSHHHSLRAFTQLLVHYVLCKLWPALKADISEDAQLERKCFEDLKIYLAENNDCKRLRKSMEKFLDAFDPTTCATPAGVFNARHEGSGFECVPVSLMEQVINFLNGVRDDLRDSMAKDAMTINNEALTASGACSGTEEPLYIGTKSESHPTSKDLILDFQKKITLNEHLRERTNTDSNCFQANAKISRFLSEVEKEDELLCPVVESRIRSMERIRGSQQELIIVASLLDRIPNLAGLARTCEVFKAAGLAVANTSILQDKQFQLISVTAEKWIPIIEVPVDSIKVYLDKKRREGFSIIGLEQTANSTSLDKYSFQNKTVLVLGREKEGIPVDIIHVLDACIEIPQLGIIRSLNVHVSGAIAMWEYTRQGRSKQT